MYYAQVLMHYLIIQVDFAGKTIFSRLFIYFLAILIVLHVFFLANLQPKYDIEYFDFLQCVTLGGGIGLFVSMVSNISKFVITYWRIRLHNKTMLNLH